MPDPSKAKNIIIPVDHYPIGRLKIIKISDELWPFLQKLVESGAKAHGQTIRWEPYEVKG